MRAMRWIRRGGALAILLIGWVFIAWQNRFHLSAPVVFVCLGYLAVVATVYNLWRTGVAVVISDDEGVDSTWAKPAGALGELEREKRTLLKAIKEAEFDHEMGKLSKRDVDEMIRTYRARAIEVIKEIDRHGGAAAAGGSPREQILREVRARLELDARSRKRPAGGKSNGAPDNRDNRDSRDGKAGKSKKKQPGKPAAESVSAAGSPGSATGPATGSTGPGDAAEAGEHAGAEDDAADRDRREAAESADREAAQDAAHDEMMNADSTTTVESPRNSAKEATP
jgi:hypothetical protein